MPSDQSETVGFLPYCIREMAMSLDSKLRMLPIPQSWASLTKSIRLCPLLRGHVRDNFESMMAKHGCLYISVRPQSLFWSFCLTNQRERSRGFWWFSLGEDGWLDVPKRDMRILEADAAAPWPRLPAVSPKSIRAEVETWGSLWEDV